MDTTPLPNQDSDLSDYDSEEDSPAHDYVVRLTPHGRFNMDQLRSFLEEEPLIFRYVVARETVPQEHFHIVLSTDVSVTEQETRDIIKAFIVPLWEDPITHKCPRGFGNKQYNLDITTTIDKAISYALKDRQEYFYVGFEEVYINELKEKSFTKKKVNNFKVEYQELCDQFKKSDMEIREFMILFVKLKAKYGQMVTMSHAYGYATSNLVSRNPEEAENLVENFLYKL